MCNEDIFNLEDKIYKTTCEIEYLNELKDYINEQEIDFEKVDNVEKETEKTKTINFKKVI